MKGIRRVGGSIRPPGEVFLGRKKPNTILQKVTRIDEPRIPTSNDETERPQNTPMDAAGSHETLAADESHDSPGLAALDYDDEGGDGKSAAGNRPNFRKTPAQLKALEDMLRLNPEPSMADRQELADRVGLQVAAVRRWNKDKNKTFTFSFAVAPRPIPSDASPRYPPGHKVAPATTDQGRDRPRQCPGRQGCRGTLLGAFFLAAIFSTF